MRYVRRITREMLRSQPDTLFVFGDNMLGKGRGGQAKEMRGEPNAVGIPTKMLPGMGHADFFSDKDFDRATSKIDAAFALLTAHVLGGGRVVWPEDGVGTGLAQLPTRAPKIWSLIEDRRVELETLARTLSPSHRAADGGDCG